jgi:V8-like Glu-specific endopeptidase
MHHNVVRFVDDAVLQYWTDTEAGSSGAPVFDEEWNVVALHHRWVERDVDGTMEFRNQGQRIERVVEELVAAGLTFGSPP